MAMTALLPLRTRMASRAGAWVGSASRRLGAGRGTVIGGRVSLAIDPQALGRLGAGRPLALVSGTNGKTTTNRLLAAALATRGPVVSNPGGSNLPSGIVAALSGAQLGIQAALEVDEAYLPAVSLATDPSAVVLLNLTRDQLDRINEVRKLASKWREAAAGWTGTHVVANADDPLVVWAAGPAGQVTWVAAGQPWKADASGCPECDSRIAFSGDEWSCDRCGLARPRPNAWLEGNCLVLDQGPPVPFELSLPGRFNRQNAAMAAMAAAVMGVPVGQGLAAMGGTANVSGRYETVDIGGVQTRMLLAKNPAGWVGMFDLLKDGSDPVVVAINARTADGRDPSWLWDVPFEKLAGRLAVAAGERAVDMAVRLAYAGVEHLTVAEPLAAIKAAGSRRVDFVGNYTAFQDLRSALRRQRR